MCHSHANPFSSSHIQGKTWGLWGPEACTMWRVVFKKKKKKKRTRNYEYKNTRYRALKRMCERRFLKLQFPWPRGKMASPILQIGKPKVRSNTTSPVMVRGQAIPGWELSTQVSRCCRPRAPGSPRKAEGDTVPLLRATMTLMPVSTKGTEKSTISDRSSLMVREPMAMSARW